jgi:hypothetical protein
VVVEYEQMKVGLDPRGEGPAAAAYLEHLGERLRAQQRSGLYSAAAKLGDRLERFPRLAGVLRPLARSLVR